MRIDVLDFDGCPNHEPAVRLAKDVVAELGFGVEVNEVCITGPEDAHRFRFLGSPTIQVNGVDVEPNARHRMSYGFCCRPYNGHGTPTREKIRNALLQCDEERPKSGEEACDEA